MKIGETMKTIINNMSFEFVNKTENIENIFRTINKTLDDNGQELSYLVIDDIPVSENYYEFFVEHIDSIKDVVVIAKELKDLVNETLVSAYDYISNVIGVLKTMAEEFYHGPKSETWEQFSNLFEGIQWINGTQIKIDSIKNLEKIVIDYSIWNQYVQIIKSLNTQFLELEKAMVSQDHVLIGDLLIYEIFPVLENAEEKLGFLILPGGNHVS